MGLTNEDALRQPYTRAETPGVRVFVAAIIQGETLGVSIGQIMRNLADEMRKRARPRPRRRHRRRRSRCCSRSCS